MIKKMFNINPETTKFLFHWKLDGKLLYFLRGFDFIAEKKSYYAVLFLLGYYEIYTKRRFFL